MADDGARTPSTRDGAPPALDNSPPPDDEVAPAFYAAGHGGWRDWWVILHPPYTAWHLAYVVIGACLAPFVNTTRLLATLLAFFFAVGVAAHALDELHGRPLRTAAPLGVPRCRDRGGSRRRRRSWRARCLEDRLGARAVHRHRSADRDRLQR